MIFIPLLIFVVVLVALFLGFLIIRKIIKQQTRIARERIRKGMDMPRPANMEPTHESQEVHYHVNSENFYSGNVGVVASDDAVVNRPNVSAGSRRTCPDCGAELNSDDIFCRKCGKRLP